MRKPSNGVAFSRPRGMLDQVLLARAARPGVSQELAYDLELVESRENLFPSFPAASTIVFHHDLGVVLKNVGKPRSGQDFLPEVIGLDADGVWWVTRAAVPTLVEGQKPRVLSPQMGAHPHLGVIYRKLNDATAEPE